MSKRKPTESVSGSYTPVPHSLLDSQAFVGVSARAKALLFELLRQHNGRNNGRLQLTRTWLKSRGWTSNDQVQKGREELLDRGLILKTKLGDLHRGPDWFALTWIAITDFSGLDIGPRAYFPGAWRMMDSAAVATPKNYEQRPAARANTSPQHGTESAAIGPQHGPVEAIFGNSSIPPHGHNECCQLPPVLNRSRIVGKSGASGVKSVSAMAEIEVSHEQ